MRQRGVGPVVGVLTMVVLTVVLAALIGGMFFGVGIEAPPEAAVTAEADRNSAGRVHVNLTHVSGDDLNTERLAVRLYVNGEPLEDQPTVPDTGMDGFWGFPNGPFNNANGTDTIWSAGEVAGFEIAKGNGPNQTIGDQITVRIFANGRLVAAARATVS